MSFFEWFFAVTSVTVSVLVLPLSILTLRLTLDRRIRKFLPQDQEYNNYTNWYLGVGRAILFGCASVWGKVNRSWQIQTFYNGVDVKGFANRFEKFIAYSFLFSLCYIVVVGSIYAIVDWTGIIDV